MPRGAGRADALRAFERAVVRLLRCRSPPHRFGGVGVLLVLAQRPPYHHQHQEDETLYHRRDLRHVELVPVPPRQERGLERVRPASPVLPLRLEDRSEKILYVVGRLNVARAQEILFPSVPEPVRLARLEVDRLSPGPANRGGSPARL
jgi:hypothetical protein